MNEITSLIQAKLNQMSDDGAIEKMIESRIEKCIEESIHEAVRSYGTIGNQLRKGLEENLKLDFSEVDFPTYNAVMLTAVKQKLAESFMGEAGKTFMDGISDILEPAPDTITFIEFVTQICSIWKQESWNNDRDDYATVRLEYSDHGDNSVSLKMWNELNYTSIGHSREGVPQLELYLIDNKIRISHKMTYNPTCLHEIDALVFKYYAAGTTITDVEELDEHEDFLIIKDHCEC